jgi:hypothetical protein
LTRIVFLGVFGNANPALQVPQAAAVERRQALDHRIADGAMEAGRFDAAGRRLTDSSRPPLATFQRDRAAGGVSL